MTEAQKATIEFVRSRPYPKNSPEHKFINAMRWKMEQEPEYELNSKQRYFLKKIAAEVSSYVDRKQHIDKLTSHMNGLEVGQAMLIIADNKVRILREAVQRIYDSTNEIETQKMAQSALELTQEEE